MSATGLKHAHTEPSHLDNKPDIRWLWGGCSTMSATGLKHAHTEPSHLDNKRETVGRRVPSGRASALRRAPSDSDCSAETASLSADSADRRPPPPPPRQTKARRRRGSEWEVLEGLKDGQRFERRPEVFNGYLHKKRKWPLKGWHKRFFVVDGGILVYARSPADVARGRLHGSVDVGLSVISAKARRRRIDIDADEFIYHLRAKTHDTFRTWLTVLAKHRLYRQHLLTFGARESVPKIHAPLEDLPPTDTSSRLLSPSAPLRVQAGFVAGTPGGRFANWIVESGGGLENAGRELGQAQLSIQQLQRLLQQLELQHQQHDTDVSLEGASPIVKKDRRKFGLRKKKSNTKCASVELAPPHVDSSASHMALSALTAPPSPGGGASSAPAAPATSAASLPIACAAARPQSLPGAEALAAGGPASLASLTPDQQLREDFTVLAKDLVTTLKTVLHTLVCERGRLRAALEAEGGVGAAGGAGAPAVLAALRTNLSSALQQNSELRSRLSRIHDASDLADISSVNNTDPVNRQLFQQSLSYSSSCVSASEFFDAEEHEPPADLLPADEAGVIELDGDSSSEAGSLSSEEGSASSDNSDNALLSAEPVSISMGESERPLVAAAGAGGLADCWVRRVRLPCPRPTPGGPSLWNLLYKNIGKDLSQVSMPVTINEPLNMLQRLCEELEYSELLDSASECSNPLERMAMICAFAVSAYAAAAHRAASKPFNPLLHETYEASRPDKGFQFLAEQVSHHPPISACHAESSRWTFWQEARIKTKFWGKSMEFQPAGRVHVRLHATGDHYSWNKVTTCVHNLFGGQRWVDQYGDMAVCCHRAPELSAKLSFIKASSWSSSRHEVRGYVTDGSTRLRLQGRWSESLYIGDPPHARLLWRPGPMPGDHELYYGFTRFAMELNELEPGMKERLPHTDTRLRPDQRALEEGDVESAERLKLSLEQAQRERRSSAAYQGPAWFRYNGILKSPLESEDPTMATSTGPGCSDSFANMSKSQEDNEDMWVFTGEYWRAREAGFPNLQVPRIW